MHLDPMEQFQLVQYAHLKVWGIDVSFTSASVMMFVAAILVFLFMTLPMRRAQMIPGRFQNICESLYEFVADMAHSTLGELYYPYFPFIFTLFSFILSCNLLGLIPYTFNVTSQIVVTFTLAIIAIIIVVFSGLKRNGLRFFSLFMPEDVPTILLPIIMLVEILSYIMRPISLSIRLFVNMMADHVIMFVFASFITGTAWYLGWIPFLFMVPFYGFEVFVDVIQAYVFTILFCVYLNEALQLHCV